MQSHVLNHREHDAGEHVVGWLELGAKQFKKLGKVVAHYYSLD
jgi:hypothetical protein